MYIAQSVVINKLNVFKQFRGTIKRRSRYESKDSYLNFVLDVEGFEFTFLSSDRVSEDDINIFLKDNPELVIVDERGV